MDITQLAKRLEGLQKASTNPIIIEKYINMFYIILL